MWALALKLLAWGIGFIFPAKDERDTERAAGEKLGKAEAENFNAKEGLNDLQRAVEAGDREAAAVDADPGRLRDPGNPAARPYRELPD